MIVSSKNRPHRSRHRNRAGVWLALALWLTLAGCVRPTRTISDPVDPPSAFSQSGTAPLPDRWWTALGDPQLDAAVDTALARNFDLLSAWERLRAARAVARAEAAGLFPVVEAFADGEVVRGDDVDDETLRLGLAAAYEVDLWGRIRSGVQAERLRATATRADYQAAALSLSGEVARTWMRLAEARTQVALVESQIETNATVLTLIENRFGLGLVRAVDILRQRQLVEATREQRVIAEGRRQVLAHQLAVLLGRPPRQITGPAPDSLPVLSPLPDVGLPLALLRRRPDVQSAFLQLQAADRDVASAVSSQFPRLSISASVSSAAGSVDDLFTGWVTSLASNLLAPVFLGGELRAEAERTRAIREQRLYEYGQTVLTALQDVEDALVQESTQRERIALIDDQLNLAQLAYEQLRVQYFNGTSTYLEVLTSLDEVQALRRELLSARLALVEQRIALHRALAGPIDTPREAS